MSTRERFFSTRGIMALLLLALDVYVGVAAVKDYQGLRAILERGVPTTAIVIAVDRRRRAPDEPKVRFVTREGTPIETWVGVHRWDGDVTVGTVRSVLYDPADPHGGVLDRQEGTLYSSHQLSALAVLALTALTFVGFWPESIWAAQAWMAVWEAEARRREAEARNRPTEETAD